MLKCIVTGQKLSVRSPLIASGSYAYLTAEISFTADWDDCTAKYAYFEQDGSTHTADIVDNRITEDKHLDLPDGIWDMRIVGYNADGTQRITTGKVELHVERVTTGFPGLEPDIVEQKIVQISAMRDETKDYTERAEAAQAAASQSEIIAAQSAEAAALSETAAAASAVSAQNDATDAKKSSSSAATSSTVAKFHAENAAKARDAAQTAADQAEASKAQAETAATGAETTAANASTSAAQAQSSAANAARDAGTASAGASSAGQSASTASSAAAIATDKAAVAITAAEEAVSAREVALDSKNAAETAKTAAEAAKTDAQSAQSAAAASATAAAQSAQTASDKAQEISESAGQIAENTQEISRLSESLTEIDERTDVGGGYGDNLIAPSDIVLGSRYIGSVGATISTSQSQSYYRRFIKEVSGGEKYKISLRMYNTTVNLYHLWFCDSDMKVMGVDINPSEQVYTSRDISGYEFEIPNGCSYLCVNTAYGAAADPVGGGALYKYINITIKDYVEKNVNPLNDRVYALEHPQIKYTIPSYLDEEYSESLQTVMSKLKNDSVVLGVMTDLHIPSKNSGYNQFLRDGVLYSMQALSNMTQDVDFDLVSFLGDYEQFPTKGNGQTKQMGFDVLLEINDYISNMHTKSIAIQGNHEPNYSGGGNSYGMTDDEFYRYCLEQVVYKEGIITDGIHCYYDDDAKHIRYVFLNNTSEGLSTDVIAFMERMSDTSYDVVVLSHFGGKNGNLYDSTKTYIDTLRAGGANVILWVSGHSHQDWHYEYNGCLVVSLLQSGFWTSSASENGTTYNHVRDTKDYCAYTVIILNKSEGKAHCVRFGLGIDYIYDLAY